MNEDMSFEDVKRLHLQRGPIPESVVDDVRRVQVLFENGLISKEQAEKRLEGIEADLRKLQALVSTDKIEEIRTGEATEIESSCLKELSEVEWKKLMYGDWIE